jgi:peptide deformylase
MSDGESKSVSRIPSMHPITGRPLSLKLYPDSALRSVCHAVETFDGWLSDVVNEMLALMRIHNGIGLAAPQVDIAQRFFAAEINGQSLCLVNPVLVARRGRGRMTEGCLSLPGVDVNIQRNSQIEVQGFDVHGCTQRYHVEGLWARVVQHEIDHLDVILICDYEKRQDGADS